MVGPAANRFAMQTHREHFSHDLGWTPNLQPIMERGLLNTDDPKHAWQRKLMNPAFAVAYMNRYLPVMAKVIEARTRDWADRGQINLYEETRRIAFDVAAEALVGFPTGPEVDRLGALFFQLLHSPADPTVETEEEFYQRIGAARTELDSVLLRMIAERRESPTDDILGMLVAARDEEGNGFSDQELLGQVHILLVAGHETTTTMNAWLLYLLAAHPDHLARVHAELDAVEGAGEISLSALRGMRFLGYALDEAGRLRPPVALVPRGVVEDYVFGGYRVPAGIQVRLGIAPCHLLPWIFPEPHHFDPDRHAPPREESKRNPYSLVTFGGGPRICIGMSFAQIEMRATAALVLRKYALEPVESKPALHVYYGLTATAPNGIHVRVSPRS